MSPNTQDRKISKGFKFGLIIIIAIFIVGVCIIKNVQKGKYEKEYEINLAAQACSVYNYTNAVIDKIENMSSLEWYLNNTNEPEEEALKTYGRACAHVLEEDHGRRSDLEPIEYKGTNQNIDQAYNIYEEMYSEYNSFCELIKNPYIPAKDFISEVYGKANNIIDLFAEVDIKFDGNIEKDYAVEDLHYGIYYRNKE